MTSVEVLAGFSGGGSVTPKVLKWGSRKYLLQKTNLSYVVKRGADRLYVFKVSDVDDNDWTLLRE